MFRRTSWIMKRPQRINFNLLKVFCDRLRKTYINDRKTIFRLFKSLGNHIFSIVSVIQPALITSTSSTSFTLFIFVTNNVCLPGHVQCLAVLHLNKIYVTTVNVWQTRHARRNIIVAQYLTSAWLMSRFATGRINHFVKYDLQINSWH